MRRSRPQPPPGPIVGAHVSIAGGIENAPGRGARLGCRAIQVFTKPPSRWEAPALPIESCGRFRSAVARERLHVVAHSAYLINLGSPARTTWRRSVVALADELRRCAQLGIGDLVLHPGAHMGAGEEPGIRRVARGLIEAHAAADTPDLRILLENTAGQGTVLGHRFDQLAALEAAVGKDLPIGFCFDTCHAFAAGHDISTKKGWTDTLEQWDRTLGLRRIGLIHVNDSKRGCGQRVDRHEQLGRGVIGHLAFRMLMAERRLTSVPKIIETPKGDDETNDRRALALLRRYATLALHRS